MRSTVSGRILIIDEDHAAAGVIRDHAISAGNEAQVIGEWDHALRALEQAAGRGASFDVVVATLEGARSAQRVGTIIRRGQGCSVIAVTSLGSVQEAVVVLQAGAADYLVRPVREDQIIDAIDRAMACHARSSPPRESVMSTGLIGGDPAFRQALELAHRAASTPATILIEGESGTGKSMLAREIHDRSPRAGGPFIEMACGSVSESLLESELFGHVKGAFTGATHDAIGRCQAADGGTLFLDEINSASEAMQLKLLRVLQEGRFEPVGSTTSRTIDVRVVAATNEGLERMVQENRFRRDLFHRLHVVAIDLPPLRDRPDDVAPLAARFLEQIASSIGKKVHGLTPEAMEAICTHSYPGNVRELRNVIERGVVLATRPLISVQDLGWTDRGGPGSPADASVAQGTLRSLQQASERESIRQALVSNAWHRTATATMLGINRATLYKKMVAHGLHTPRRSA